MKRQYGYRRSSGIALALSLVAHAAAIILVLWAGTAPRTLSQPVTVMLHGQEEARPRETVSLPRPGSAPRPQKQASAAPPASPPAASPLESSVQVETVVSPVVRDADRHGVQADEEVEAHPAQTQQSQTETSDRGEAREQSAPLSDSRRTDARRAYLSLLKSRIEEHKEYPLTARKGRQEGTVIVTFVLSRNGLLMQARVAKTSGAAILDAAAVRAVHNAGRFPPVPEDLEGPEVAFDVPVTFTLKDR